MSESDRILVRRDGGVGHVVFNNPQKLNAMSLAMWEQLARTLEEFHADDAVRVVVLSGAGTKAFVAGADISRFENERASEEAVTRYNATVERTSVALREFPKPTIAMIRGYCIGGGLGIALCCDLRIATEESVFALPAAKLGLGYNHHGIKLFVDIVGPAFAKEVFFTARQFNAQEAHAMGLVNRVLPAAELESFVKAYTDAISANAPLTIAAGKFAVGEMSKDESKRDEARCAEMVQRCFASRDYEEGRRAFMEKRKPVFQGR